MAERRTKTRWLGSICESGRAARVAKPRSGCYQPAMPSNLVEEFMSIRLPDFSAFVFDMDGVLLDTEKLYRQAMQKACADLGFTMSDALFASQVGVPGAAGDKILIKAFGDDFPLGRYNAATLAQMQTLLSEDIPVKSGVHRLLETLREKNVPAAVATSTAKPLALDRLDRAGLLGFFQTVVTSTDCTNGKPHPEPFETAARRLDVQPERCIALEDSHNGVRSAHAAGMKVIMVPDLLEPTEEIAALCTGVLPSLDAVHEAAFAQAPSPA